MIKSREIIYKPKAKSGLVMKKVAAILLFVIMLVVVQSGTCQARKVGDSPPVTILSINDVYLLEPLAYVRSLREQLEKEYGEVLLLHAGDFLFPSLLSRRYKGEQMVDVLNLLDGDGRGFDPRMFIIFGNHEFDKSKMKYAGMLQDRIQKSQFTWINSNVEFGKTADGRPLVLAEQMLPDHIVTVNGVRVGLLGVVTDVKKAEYIKRFLPNEEVIREGVARLRKQGAEVVVAITHLNMSQDKKILEALGNSAPDLIIGGHEHDRQTVLVNGRRIVKADSDAKTAAIVQITPMGEQEMPDVQLEYVELPGNYKPYHKIMERAAVWNKRFDAEFCQGLKEASGCLDQPLGKTKVDLIGEELTIRRFETNLGNWLVDLARKKFEDQGAQIAFLNSGGMRLNRNIAAGSTITRRDLYTLFAYPTKLVRIKMSGATLQKVLNHAITDWAGSGHWLQISGFTYKHDPQNQTASDLHLITESGLKPIGPKDELTAVVNEYLINEKGDQDGYRMIDSSLIIDPEAKRPNLVEYVVEQLRKAGQKGISPSRDGRICNVRDRGLDCLLK